MSSTQILFATIHAGGGHLATAEAMAQEVRRLEPRVETEVSDYMLALGLHEQDRRHKDLWRWLLGRPALVRGGQRILDAFPSLTLAVHRMMLAELGRRTARDLADRRPALVVANHGWLGIALAMARRRHGSNVPSLVFATEPLDANALWAEPSSERVVAPSSAARRDLVRLGVPRERIDVVGYPVRSGFLRPPSQSESRRRLGLDDTFTVLVSLGGEGVGRQTDEIVEQVLATGARTLVVAGRNERLRKRLEERAVNAPNLVVFGWVERMWTLVSACDVVVGKAGPASTMEALAVGRPVLATAFAGLNERRVVDFLVSQRLGGYVPDGTRLASELAAYRSDPASLEEVRTRAAELDFPTMTEDLARYVLHYALHRKPPAGWTSTGLPDPVL